MKKLLLLIVMMLPLVASADPVEMDGIYYNFDRTAMTAEVTSLYYQSGDEYSGAVIIPTSINYNGESYSVTSIGNSAFYYCRSLTSITIPNSVKSIEPYAFEGCSALTAVHISDLAAWCKISFSSSVSNPLIYAHHLYLEEDEITDLVIPNNVTSISNRAFCGCDGLISVTIPNGVTSIGSSAFSDCRGLTSINVPSSVKSIGEHAFYGCCSLTSVTIPNGVTSIEFYTFAGCSSLTSIVLPNSLTSIENSAFEGCNSLVYATIPNDVTRIGSCAFAHCSSLAFITMPNGLTKIEQGTFAGCKSLSTITIPNNVTTIEKGGYSRGDYYGAFSGCSSLTSVTIPPSVTSIGQYAFIGCNALSAVYISDLAAWCDIKFEDSYANPLYYAHHLYLEENEITDLVIPNNVTAIGDYAFNGCSSMATVTIPNSVTTIGIAAFSRCSELTSVIIPNSVTSIGDYTFDLCGSLLSIIIPNKVSRIGQYTFRSCCSLSSVTIPNSVTNIGYCAFVDCSSLSSVTIPNSVTNIDEQAFQDCNKMTILNLPNKLKIIKKNTFYGCNSLKAVTIPASVEFIYQEAFANCDALESVKAKPGTPPFLYDNSFSNYSVPLEVPKGCKEEYQTAQGWKNFTNISESDKGYYMLIYLIDNEKYKSYKIEEGTAITPEPAPTKDGYTFSGWSEIPETMPAHDVTVTGSFSINKYKLTYVVDGVEYKSYNIEYGATLTPEAEPTKEGYTFSGWSEIPATMPNHDVTVTGTFAINSYKLTYIVDGEVYKSYDIEYGATITPEAEPTKEGYTFSGWSEIPETMPAHDVTVTGTFSINKYKLTYVVDGVEYKSYDIEYGATITPEAEPTKEGYTFSGWSEIPQTMPANDVTVTGSFSKGQYKLIYMLDGQTYKTISYDYGDAITPEPAPTKEGYTFSGWSEIPETMPAHDVTVTGLFSINSYKLTYTVNGEVYKTYDVEYGTAITPEAEPTKEGYTFSGWSEIPETMPAHDVTVIGTFSINSYKLTYVVDGVEYKSYDFEYGATITPEAEPTKEGYTFSGWSTIPETMPAHDVTITGTFIINKYKLTYIVDGEVYKSYDIEYGASITPEAEPTKEGYTFSGWSEIPATMPAYDVTITGSFTKGAYKLTYMLDGVVYKTISYDYGDAITPEPVPTKEGYTFSGWSEIPETMPAHDVMVTGTFSINKYKLTYTVDGEVYKTYEIEYGATITPEAEPAKEGYTFSGWSEIPATMPAHDVTVTGTFTLDTGIEQIMSNANGDVMIFTIDGKRVDNLKKGMNIIRMSDGTTRKVVVK